MTPIVADVYKKNQLMVILLICFLSLGIRVIYYNQIKDSPLLYQHYWTETDMNFFHKWAYDIAEGDWLTNKALHPYHTWHSALAHQEYKNRGGKNWSDDVGRDIWNRWYGQKKFHQEPLYPYFLAVIYKFFDGNTNVVFAAQFFIGILNNLLIYVITRRYFGDMAALLAAFIAVFYGPFLYYESILLRPTLIIFTSLLTVWLLGVAFDREKPGYFLLSGSVIGVCFLAKSTFALFFLLLLLFLPFYYRKNIKRGFSYILLLVFGSLIALSPLIIRNLIVNVAPLATSSVGAITFIDSNASDVDSGAGFYISSYSLPIMNKTQGKFLPSIYATLRTHANIYSYIKLLCRKFLIFWNWREIPNNTNYYYYRLYSSLLSHWMLTFSLVGILSFAGLFLAYRTFNESFMLYFLFIAGILPSLVFYNLSRFRILAVPALIPFAAYCLVFVTKQIFAKKYFSVILIIVISALLANLFFLSSPQNKQLIRPADYLAGNEICMGRTNEAIKRSDHKQAFKIIESGIKTEPGVIADSAAANSTIDQNKTIEDSFGKMRLIYSELNKKLSHP